MRNRYRVLGYLFICVSLVACTSATESPSASDVTPIADAEAQADSSCEEGQRLFDHEHLATDPVCIPENPQRVVTLDLNSLEFMLIHDLPFVSSSEIGQIFLSSTHPEWLDTFITKTEGLPDTGTFPPNLEAVAEAQPDLIITAPGYYDEATNDLLAEIAPTIVYEPGDVLQDWQPQFHFIADSLGMTEENEALVVAYKERLEGLRASIGDSLNGQTISVVRARPDQEMGLRLAGSFTGFIINQLDLEQPESQQPLVDEATGFVQIDVSRERWDLADGDHLFVYGVQPDAAGTNEAQALIESLKDDAIWNNLNAVQNGNAYAMDAHWHGFGVLSAHEVIDDMFRILAKTEPSIPNPLLEPGA